MGPTTSDLENSTSRRGSLRACRQRKVVSPFLPHAFSPLQANTHHSERKIDQMDKRLESIERLLQRLANETIGDSNKHTELYARSIEVNTPPLSGSGNNLHASETGVEFEGDSSLAAHTAAATEAFQRVVRESSFQNPDPALTTTLSSLHEIVSQVSKTSSLSNGGLGFKHVKSLPRGGLSELPMPPMPAVFAALHGTNADFIIVNAGLYYIFLECSFIAEGDTTRQEYRAHAQVCQSNLETALSSLSLVLPHNYDTVEALLLGATYAIEVSRASLAWLLNSTAITIGQTLGFHRSASLSAVSTDKNIKHDDQALLFWTAYTFDKGLALRLGYAPIMTDDDINVSMSPIDSISFGWSDIFRAWVSHATLQGRIYDQLYCASALVLPASHRQARVPPLVAEMRTLIAEAFEMAANDKDRDQSSSEFPPNYTLRSVFVHANLVSFLGSLTLIYRGCGEAYVDDCLQSAREAMEMHIRFLGMLDEDSGVRGIYIHWAILYIPFVPFTVIFCHVIKSPDQEDMDRLERFVQSLQSSCAISESITKLHMVCSILCDVATQYVEIKTRHQTGDLGKPFDKYLNALGLMPSYEHGHNVRLEDATRGSEVENWYYGNRDMMGLLE
ncbi:fungal specific transcription factor factor domain-containing protein [Fusarium bulbicola]|nr:fungal specific transcription factor factor domain-containing protein [Fusarium bulbicola]